MYFEPFELSNRLLVLKTVSDLKVILYFLGLNLCGAEAIKWSIHDSRQLGTVQNSCIFQNPWETSKKNSGA